GAQGLLQRRSRAHFAGAGACGNEAARSVLVRAVSDLQLRYPERHRLSSRDRCLGGRHPQRRWADHRLAEYNWSIPGGLKNAIDWVSRMKDQPFNDKPVVLQSVAGGILGGSRMQYHLRQSLTSVDALLFGRPEMIVTFAAQKFDEKTLELKDQTAI